MFAKIAANPRAVQTPRAHAPGFTVISTAWVQTGRFTYPPARDHGWGDFDRIPAHQPFLLTKPGLPELKSTARVVYRTRPSSAELRIGRHLLRNLPNIDRCRSRRPEKPRLTHQDKRLMREYPTLIVRHYHGKETGWVTTPVELDAAALVLDRLSDHPDWLALTHLSVITKDGRRVKLGTALRDAYDLMGIEQRHWLDAFLGVHDNRYARFAARQARLAVYTDDDDLSPPFN